MKRSLKVKEILKSVAAMAAFAIIAVLLNITVYAADFNASVSSGEATQGENVTVTVTMSSGVTVGAYDLALTYDANILEYVSGADGGGGGSLRLYNDSNYSTSYTVTITFKAIAAGSTKISVVKQGDVCDIDLNDLIFNATDGTVTVKAPVAASSNANLSSLSLMAVKADGWSGSVSLMPDFSKDVTSYQLWLGSEFNKLSISAVPEDDKAKIATAGTELKAGQDNTTTITVTAEDGTVKTYTIIVHVKAETATDATTAEENNNTDTPTDAPTDSPADDPQDTTTGNENPSGADDRNVTISEVQYTVLDVPEDLELPEGFERKAVSWNGIEVTGASDQSGTLILLYLQNKESNESRFYVYNSEKSSYTPFMSYTITQRTYVMLMADDDLIFEGEKATESKALELTTLNVAGGYVDAYKLKNAENIYIVRAMNWDNKIGYYYYSAIDGSMTPYFETAVKVQDNNVVQPVTNSAKESDMTELLFWISVGLSVVLILIIIVLVINVRRLSAANREYAENDQEDNEEIDDESEKEAYEETNIADEINENAKVNNIEAQENEVQDEAAEELIKETEVQETAAEELIKKAGAQEIAAESEVQEAAEELMKEIKAQEEASEELVKEAEAQEEASEELVKEAEAEEAAAEELMQEVEAQEAEAEEQMKEAQVQETKAQEMIPEKKEIEAAAQTDVLNKNTAKQNEENMSEQELDSAIDDILGQLFK